ncbi:MAG: phenylalanine--tRNA ligase subunit beta [Synergistaceae bacterium]|jgi:phenylalanyl-tRNA synthetase beta chain|nr:phenylalanine--tRNA ligase subunit beta [Synergistaceae bacterium]
MKLSLKWIKDYVKIPGDIEVSRIAHDLTMSTVEVEGIYNLGEKFDKMAVGVIDEILPHPNADRLKICRANLGNGETYDIVCGGANLRTGMKAAVSRPGAMVRWHGAGDLVEIKNARVRGVESYGMICSSSEIGLFDLFPFTEEATIVDLSDFEAAAGTPLAEALGLDDVILEIDNRSLTNRPDLWGHYGIAREISALYGLPLSEFEKSAPAVSNRVSYVEVKDGVRCPRYILVKIEGLSVKPSPFEIQSRIWRVGMRPINAIVDITNYVMLAVGQPTHAFDSDNIEGRITVRRARGYEKLLLLNGRELVLSPDDLVIADDEGSVGLAGVMGGAKDSVLPTTDKVILEIANFEPIGIRRTAARHEAHTEAAARYEKGIDPERCDQALSIAMKMFGDFFPDMEVTGFHDNYPVPLKRVEIDVSLEWLSNRLGKRIANEKISDMLARLGFGVKFSPSGDAMHVTAPTWRSTGDVSLPDDIMEEAARMHGYENFEPSPIVTAFSGAINQPETDIDRNIREYLSFRCGMREIFTYPWVNDEYLDAVFQNRDGMLALSTPPSPNERYIRSSLLPNIFKAVSENLRFFDEFAIFESAQVFSDEAYSTPYDPRESLPRQRRSAAGAFVGGEGEIGSIFRKAKGVVEWLPRYTHTEPFSFERHEKPRWAEEAVWLNIVHSGEVIGNLALLSKKSSLSCGIKNSTAMAFELDIDSLKPLPSRTNKYSHLPGYPWTEYDISMVFDESVKWEDILSAAAVRKGPEDLLRGAAFMGEYRGKQVAEGKKSITLRLLIGSLKKTLTSEEIESCANTIIKRLKKTVGGELRN